MVDCASLVEELDTRYTEYTHTREKSKSTVYARAKIDLAARDSTVVCPVTVYTETDSFSHHNYRAQQGRKKCAPL